MGDLSIKALMLNQLVTNHFFDTHYPLTFIFDKNRFVAEEDHKKLKWFYICWMLYTSVVWPLATLYVLLYQGIFHPNLVSPDRMFFILILSAPMLLGNSMNWCVLPNTREIAQYLNLLFDLSQKYKPKMRQSYQSLVSLVVKETKKLLVSNTRRQADLVGLFMIGAVLFFALIPILYIPIPFLLNVDPTTFAIQSITQYNKLSVWIHLPVHIVTGMGAIICAAETTRSIRTVFLLLIYSAKSTADLLKYIRNMSKNDVSKGMELYKVMYAVHVKSMRPASMLLFCAIEGGMFISILTLTGTFVGWKVLSPITYWMSPAMGSMSIIIIAIALPCAAYNADLSESLINEWKYKVQECKRGCRKLNERTLKTFQPMAFYMSGFGYLLKHMKTRMFETIVMNTVDTVIMVNDFIG